MKRPTMRLDSITIPRRRNEYGWYVVTTIYEGQLITVRYDRKPSKHQARLDLIKEYERKCKS